MSCFRLRAGQQYRRVSKDELATLLREWRELENSVARAENALLKYYYKRTRPNQEVVLTVLAAA